MVPGACDADLLLVSSPYLNLVPGARARTSRGLMDGGEQERKLAMRYRERSETFGASPRTKKMLRKLADTYESDA